MAKGNVTRFDLSRGAVRPEPPSAPAGQDVPLRLGIQTQPIVFSPANKCIYCGAEGEGVTLSREHIVPLSLNGYAIIPRASCLECQKIIHRYETDCTANGFLYVRTHLKYSSRHPKNRPTHLPVRYGEEAEQRFVPIDDHPFILVMPRFPEPGILTGTPPRPGVYRRLEAYADPVTVKKVASRHSVPSLNVDVEFNVKSFTLMLAKIAHGVAWATVGEDGFQPFLPDLIRLRNVNLMSYLVGEAQRFVSIQASMERDNLIRVVLHPFSEGHLILIGIKLFSAFPSPTYCVVAGKFLPSKVALDRLGLSLSGSTLKKVG